MRNEMLSLFVMRFSNIINQHLRNGVCKINKYVELNILYNHIVQYFVAFSNYSNSCQCVSISIALSMDEIV